MTPEIGTGNVVLSLRELLNGNFTISGNLTVNNITVKGLIIEESVAHINNNFPNMMSYLGKNTIYINRNVSRGAYKNDKLTFYCVLPNGSGIMGQRLKIVNNNNIAACIYTDDGKFAYAISPDINELYTTVLELFYDGNKWLSTSMARICPVNYVYNYDGDIEKKIPVSDGSGNSYDTIKIISDDEDDINLSIEDGNKGQKIVLINSTNKKIIISDMIAPDDKNVLNIFGDIIVTTFINSKWYYGCVNYITVPTVSISPYVDSDYIIIDHDKDYQYTGILINGCGIENKKIYIVNNHDLNIKMFVNDGRKYVNLPPLSNTYFMYDGIKWTYENQTMENASNMYEFNNNEDRNIPVGDYDIIKINTQLTQLTLGVGYEGQIIYLYNANNDSVKIENIVPMSESFPGGNLAFGNVSRATFTPGGWYETVVTR